MLAWWDEPAELLEGCVRSLAGFCDKVVAVDGAYEMTPGATADSPNEQKVAIAKAASEVGLEYAVVAPDDVWSGQVAKRDFMLRLAAPEADWLIAVDADHRLRGDSDRLRRQLEIFADGVMSIRHGFHTPMPDDPADLERIAPHRWHLETAGLTVEHCLLFRSLDDMHVEREHWGYTGVLNGERIALGSNWGATEHPQGRSMQTQHLVVDHVCFQRDLMRLDRNREYCLVRDEFRVENGYEP
jgi:hypothetical protein